MPEKRLKYVRGKPARIWMWIKYSPVIYTRGGKTRADLDVDRLLNLALTRLVEIIGEAANRVPDSIQSQYPDLPWLQMNGVRNRLIHGYDNVDMDIFWAIVQQDLPIVIHKLERIIESREDFRDQQP